MAHICMTDLEKTQLGGFYWSTDQLTEAPDTEAPSASKNYKKRKSFSLENLFACDKCNYCCTQSSTLRIHQKTHTGEKPFACDQCDFRCTKRSYFDAHCQKTHPAADLISENHP
jgi:uncharacterized Zn-finger protein